MKNDPLFSTSMYKRNLYTNFQGKILKLTVDFRQKQMDKQPRDREIHKIRENMVSKLPWGGELMILFQINRLVKPTFQPLLGHFKGNNDYKS